MSAIRCKHAIVILIDDASGEKLLSFLNQGLLPNLKQHVLDRGSFCQHSICQFPSSSSNGHTTLATGNFASRSGVVNALWWDATTGKTPVPYKVDAINVSTLSIWDKIVTCKTMFEYLPPRESASFHMIKRGAGYRFFELRHLLKYLGLFLKLKIKGVANVTSDGDVLGMLTLDVLKGFVRGFGKKGKVPRLMFVMIVSTDDMAHKHGFDSEEYMTALKQVDTIVGMIVNGFEENGHHVPGLKDVGEYDQAAIALVADHASIPFDHDKLVDIVKQLRTDFPWHCYSAPVLVKGEKHDDWDALTFQADEGAHLYLRGDDGRALRHISALQLQDFPVHGTSINFKEYFFSREAFARLYHEIDPDTILVHDRVGIGCMSRQGGKGDERSYKYEVLEGDDPLAYTTDAPDLVDGQYHSHLDWLRGTCQATYPNVPEHMFGFFDCGFAPTLVAIVKPGWVCHHPEDPQDQTATFVNMHGSELRYEVSTPLVIGGAGVKRGMELDVCQNVDMLPTILKLLGISFNPGDFHGRPLDELLDMA